MKNVIKIGLAFVAGLTAGAIAMKKYYESKYDFEEECEEVEEDKEVEEDNVNQEKEDKTEEKDTEIKIEEKEIKICESNKDEFNRILADMRYRNEIETMEILGEDFISKPFDPDYPYRIRSDEFMEHDDYESDDYTYFADGYVTDSMGMPISDEDVARTIGVDFEDYFINDDSLDELFIRNDRLKMDFSIARDLDNFVDVATPRIKRMFNLDLKQDVRCP